MRELPLLEALAVLEREHGIDFLTLSEYSRLARDQVVIGVEALIEDGYVTVSPSHDFGGKDWVSLRLLGPGRRAVRQWPAEENTGQALVDVLEQRLEETDDPEEQSRLERMRDAVKGLGVPPSER